MIESAIKSKEKYILEKNSMQINADLRFDQEIKSSSMLESNAQTTLMLLAEKDRSYLLWSIEEEKSFTSLKSITKTKKDFWWLKRQNNLLERRDTPFKTRIKENNKNRWQR